MLSRPWRAKSKRGKDAGSLDSRSYRGDCGRRIAPLCSRQGRERHLLEEHHLVERNAAASCEIPTAGAADTLNHLTELADQPLHRALGLTDWEARRIHE